MHDLEEQEGEKRVMVVLHTAGSISLPSQLSLALEPLVHLATSQSTFPGALFPYVMSAQLPPHSTAMSMGAPIQGRGFVRIHMSTSGENGGFG